MTVEAVAAELQRRYADFKSGADQKALRTVAHFSTPAPIARYMAEQCVMGHRTDTIKILDPGCGDATLAVAVALRAMESSNIRKILVWGFETHDELRELARHALCLVQEVARKRGRELEYDISGEDFIDAWRRRAGRLFEATTTPQVDAVIMNPPYFKLARQSKEAMAMSHVVDGQPNIYALFMAAGADFLVEGGTLTAITPRSYCNGPYFKAFRAWFLQHVEPVRFHLFGARDRAFRKDAVLQENLITTVRKGPPPRNVKISVSRDDTFSNTSSFAAPRELIVQRSDPRRVIYLPENEMELAIVEEVNKIGRRFEDSAYRISTGPVVTFRARSFLSENLAEEGTVPLLSMHNVKPFSVTWPIVKGQKPLSFRTDSESYRLLIPTRNYVLLKRFTTKEEPRRVVAGVLLAKDWAWTSSLAIENHLNYIRKESSQMNEFETWGLAAYLNSTLIDRYIRTFNGLTQVNAEDIRSIPLPSETQIIAIGTAISRAGQETSRNSDRVVYDVLGIESTLVGYLNAMRSPDLH